MTFVTAVHPRDPLKIEPDSETFALTMKGISATKDSLTVEFSQELAAQGESGVNLSDRHSRFTFKLDELTKLDTPTLDAGISYEFLLTSSE